MADDLHPPRLTAEDFEQWWTEHRQRLVAVDLRSACLQAAIAGITLGRRRSADEAARRRVERAERRASRAAEMNELVEQGLTFRAIADRFGVTCTVVPQTLRRAGYPAVRERLTPCAGGCGARTRAEFCHDCRVRTRVQARTLKSSIHGEVACYRRGCRCEPCRAANTSERRSRIEERMRRLGGPPSHGFSGYQNYGCRCEVCRAANTDHVRSQTGGRV